MSQGVTPKPYTLASITALVTGTLFFLPQAYYLVLSLSPQGSLKGGFQGWVLRDVVGYYGGTRAFWGLGASKFLGCVAFTRLTIPIKSRQVFFLLHPLNHVVPPSLFVPLNCLS
jgi:hypothetical protein